MAVVPVVHPADHVALAAGRVLPGHRRVVVLAVVDPVGALQDGLGGLLGGGELVGQDVAPAAGVHVDDLDPRLLAGVGTQVEGRPVQGLAVGAGGTADDLAVDEQVDGRLRGDAPGLGVGHDDVVDVEVAPAAGVVVGDPDPGLLAGEVADVPGGPVERFGVLSGGAADDLAVHQELDGGGVVGAGRVVAAADEEVDVLLVDGELGRGEGARGGVAVQEGVGQPVSQEAGDLVLAGEGAGGRCGAEGVSGRSPVAVGAALEVGEDRPLGRRPAQDGSGLVRVPPTADLEVQIGAVDGEFG